MSCHTWTPLRRAGLGLGIVPDPCFAKLANRRLGDKEDRAVDIAGSRRAFLKSTLGGIAAMSYGRAAARQTTVTSGAAPTIASGPVPVLGDGAQLFVDLDRIEQMENVRQVYHVATKHPGNPVVRKVKPWEDDRGTWGSVIYDPDEKLFKAWYGAKSGRQKEYRPGSLSPCSVLCYATSKDGIHWDRPELGLHEVMGTRQNNVVVNDDHHNGLDHWESTLKDPLETNPRRRYKALGWSSYDWDGPMSGIYTMTSPDGLRWEHTPEPVFRFHPRPGTSDLGPVGDSHGLMIDTLRRRHVAYLRGLPNRLLSVSQDFKVWTPPRMCIPAREAEVANTLYNHVGFVYGDRYLGFLTYFKRDSRDPLLTVRLITSRDGETWQRPETGAPLIDVGGVGEWDRFLNMMTGGPPIRVGDRLYIYYRGLANRHKVEDAYAGKDNAWQQGGGLGLATLRVDGFASLDASYDGGRVTTRPFRPAGPRLCVNAKADFGRLRAEALDERGRPVAGFTKEECLPIQADSVDHIIRWKENEGIGRLGGRAIRLRFYLENVRLYSFRVMA
jgi:hypothetical protein